MDEEEIALEDVCTVLPPLRGLGRVNNLKPNIRGATHALRRTHFNKTLCSHSSGILILTFSSQTVWAPLRISHTCRGPRETFDLGVQ